jgi:hypothetical protein
LDLADVLIGDPVQVLLQELGLLQVGDRAETLGQLLVGEGKMDAAERKTLKVTLYT